MDRLTTIKAAACTAAAALTAFWGWTGWLAAAWFLAMLLDYATGSADVLLCPLVTAWYLLTELGSIAENAGALGAPMPQFLMRAIAALRAGISDRGGGDGDGGGAA